MYDKLGSHKQRRELVFGFVYNWHDKKTFQVIKLRGISIIDTAFFYVSIAAINLAQNNWISKYVIEHALFKTVNICHSQHIIWRLPETARPVKLIKQFEAVLPYFRKWTRSCTCQFSTEKLRWVKDIIYVRSVLSL